MQGNGNVEGDGGTPPSTEGENVTRRRGFALLVVVAWHVFSVLLLVQRAAMRRRLQSLQSCGDARRVPAQLVEVPRDRRRRAGAAGEQSIECARRVTLRNAGMPEGE